MAMTRQICTFRLQGLLFGVAVTRVQEVLRYQEMTSVPLAPPVIRGLLNLRGQIVTALDMRERLELPPRGSDELPMNVVIRGEEGAMSLLVDEIGDVIEVSEDCFEPPLETLPQRCRELIAGVYKLERELLLLLDTDKAIRVEGTSGPAPKRVDDRNARGALHVQQ